LDALIRKVDVRDPELFALTVVEDDNKGSLSGSVDRVLTIEERLLLLDRTLRDQGVSSFSTIKFSLLWYKSVGLFENASTTCLVYEQVCLILRHTLILLDS